MAKLRKMLGDVFAPELVELRGVIETQSKETLTLWAVDYAQENFLRIYEKAYPKGPDFGPILDAVRGCAKGELKLKDIKPLIKEAREIGKNATDNPAAQAAARAIGTACATIQTPTSALGYTFYGAAAIAYDAAGFEEKPEVYDALADKEFKKILQSLKERAVPDEQNPVKVNWNC